MQSAALSRSDVPAVFNTVDGRSNAFLGWFIDDAQITASSVCPLQGGPVQPT